MLFGVIQKENTKISLEVWVKTFFRRSGSETSSYFKVSGLSHSSHMSMTVSYGGLARSTCFWLVDYLMHFLGLGW